MMHTVAGSPSAGVFRFDDKQGFRNSRMMNATAVTWVFWNIGKCPVPPGFDARLVGPCIKGFLEKSGYSGPLTIVAIGLLTDFPHELLQTLSSSGIVLHLAAYGTDDFQSIMFARTANHDPPANIMAINDPTDLSCATDLYMLKRDGFNIILPYPFRPAECAWQNFLQAESGALEADKCIETGESVWVCSACFTPTGRLGVTGQGFESFSTHISSQEHADSVSEFIMPPSGSESDEDHYDEEPVEAKSGNWPPLPPARLCGAYFPPSYPTTTLMHQPQLGNRLPPATMEMHQPQEVQVQHGRSFGYGGMDIDGAEPKANQTPDYKEMYLETLNKLANATSKIDELSSHVEDAVFWSNVMRRMYPDQVPPSQASKAKPHVFTTPSEYHGKEEPEGNRTRARIWRELEQQKLKSRVNINLVQRICSSFVRFFLRKN